MDNYDGTPAFNLKVVVNETGVKPDTLRAWERRYGLPVPQRTDGGHRLYSQNDIDTIKWLLARQSEGMSISHAVKLWRSLEIQGRDPIVELGSSAEPELKIPDYASGPAIDELRNAWIQACLNFDENRAENILTQAFALYSPVSACIELLQKGLSQIGVQWYNDEASVQQEHFASALAMRRLNSLVAAAPPPTKNGRILIGCPPHEDHTFAPLLLTLMLRYRGWELLYLGANVPQARFEATIQSINPHLIILTAQTLHTAATLAGVSDSIENQNVPLGFGGSIFNRVPELQDRIYGHYLGTDFVAAVDTVEHIFVNKPKLAKVPKVPEIYQTALKHYQNEQAMIEAKTWQILQKSGMPYEHFVNANIHLARDVIASLTFGDMRFIEAEIAWVEKLLVNYNMPPTLLKQYLETYYKMLSNHLDSEVAAPIIEWLGKISSEL
ncbi:MAG: MerR family transcriptional regulator [Chloroflexota bacterium]